MNLFDCTYPLLKINKPIRLIELFAGIGAQAKALENLGADFEHYRVCEFDAAAVRSYNAVHGTDFTVSDVTKIHASDLNVVDTDKYCYILTYSFPCTDLSNAGKMMGMSKGSGTRSGLLWEVERLLNEMDELPQILVMENVPAVVGEQNRHDFNEWLRFLFSKGYTSKWQILNAKDYGIPQNRERCFMVSYMGEYLYEFPEKIQLNMRMKDMLDREVDEKYYVKGETAQRLCSQLLKVERERERAVIRYAPAADRHSIDTHGTPYGVNRREIGEPLEISATLMARDYKGLPNIQLSNGVVYKTEFLGGCTRGVQKKLMPVYFQGFQGH